MSDHSAISDHSAWISAVRRSHDRFAEVVGSMSDEQVTAPSYASEWSIADTASHLGSQAEIFAMFLAAGLSGEEPPDSGAFGPIWERWNTLTPAAQVLESVAANAQFVATIEGLSEAERDNFALAMFGMDLDLSGMLTLRLGEHALHTWDIAVMADPDAQVSPDAVALLIDRIADLAGRAGKPIDGSRAFRVATTAPDRRFVLTVGPEVSLAEDSSTDEADVTMPAEALVRLIYGRLDAAHLPPGLSDDDLLITLREVFPGF